MVAATAKMPPPPNAETMWYYRGADSEVYGPYTGQTMFDWVKTGYFKDSLLVKTEQEEVFHTLGEWNRVLGGKLPFFFANLTNFESAVNLQGPQPQLNPPMQPQFFFPPGLNGPPPAAFPPHPQFSHPTGMPNFYSPHDPVMANHPPPDMHDMSGYPVVEPPKPVKPTTRSIGTDPIFVTKRDVPCQTDIVKISKEKVATCLYELTGQKVHVML